MDAGSNSIRASTFNLLWPSACLFSQWLGAAEAAASTHSVRLGTGGNSIGPNGIRGALDSGTVCTSVRHCAAVTLDMAVTGRCQIDIETMHLFDGETVAHRSICSVGLGEFNASQQKDAWPGHGHGTARSALMLPSKSGLLLSLSLLYTLLPAKPFSKQASNYQASICSLAQTQGECVCGPLHQT